MLQPLCCSHFGSRSKLSVATHSTHMVYLAAMPLAKPSASFARGSCPLSPSDSLVSQRCPQLREATTSRTSRSWQHRERWWLAGATSTTWRRTPFTTTPCSQARNSSRPNQQLNLIKKRIDLLNIGISDILLDIGLLKHHLLPPFSPIESEASDDDLTSQLSIAEAESAWQHFRPPPGLEHHSGQADAVQSAQEPTGQTNEDTNHIEAEKEATENLPKQHFPYPSMDSAEMAEPKVIDKRRASESLRSESTSPCRRGMQLKVLSRHLWRQRRRATRT